VIAGVIFYRKKLSIPDAISIPLSLFFAFLLHTYILKNHAMEHDFSALKWQFLLAMVPFTLFPMLCSGEWLLRGNLRQIATFGLPILGCVWLFFGYPKAKIRFPKPELDYEEVALWLNQHAAFLDVFFSPDLEIPENPPQLLAISNKRVYKANSLRQIKQFVQEKGLPDRIKIHVLLLTEDGAYHTNEASRVVRFSARESANLLTATFGMQEFNKLCSDSMDIDRPFRK
jgi:hypothetical protein